MLFYLTKWSYFFSLLLLAIMSRMFTQGRSPGVKSLPPFCFLLSILRVSSSLLDATILLPCICPHPGHCHSNLSHIYSAALGTHKSYTQPQSIQRVLIPTPHLLLLPSSSSQKCKLGLSTCSDPPAFNMWAVLLVLRSKCSQCITLSDRNMS